MQIFDYYAKVHIVIIIILQSGKASLLHVPFYLHTGCTLSAFDKRLCNDGCQFMFYKCESD